MTYSEDLREWQIRFRNARNIADATIARNLKDARRLCSESGLDPDIIGLHPHNAMVSYHQGCPWTGIDYGKVKQCQHTLRYMFLPNRVLRAYDELIRPVYGS